MISWLFIGFYHASLLINGIKGFSMARIKNAFYPKRKGDKNCLIITLASERNASRKLYKIQNIKQLQPFAK
jgi:hypothetical protein